MTIDELVVHNFGVYKKRQPIPLRPPSPQKPIVLFGGLNGVGKTTLLDALQLVLYGKQAKCSNRGSLGYEAFLGRCISRAVDPREGAALEIQFRHLSDGKEQVYRVHRSWFQNGSGIKETLEVLHNGSLDRLLTDSWAEFVDQFIPSRLANLFFFDGEQIESFADLTNAAELIRSAISSLLGLDLVDSLGSDLVVLERRKRAGGGSKIDRGQIEDLEREIQELNRTKEELVQQRAAAQNYLDQKQKRLAQLDAEISAAGGSLFEQRTTLENNRAELAAQIASGEERLRELAGGVAPFFLVRSLLARTRRQVEREQRARQAGSLHATLSERDSAVVRLLQKSKVTEAQIAVLESFLANDRRSRTKESEEPQYLGVSSENEELFPHIEESLLPESQERIRDDVRALEDLRSQLFDIDRKLAAVPEEATLAPKLSQRQELAAALAQVRTQMETLDTRGSEIRGQAKQREAKLHTLMEVAAKERLDQDDRLRFTTHSQRVRQTLLEFRGRVVSRHIQRIEHLVLDSFRQLLRKQRLVAGLRINEETFALELQGADGAPLPSERLSAGERQLLGVSLLWGLARASGRPLPAVIDTPLGRLDSSHRRHLVERYFPYASHQVLLLSTDEEIRGESYQKLARWIGHSYRLDFDQADNATTIETGYLEGC